MIAEAVREVRIERWSGRAFYVVSCGFRVDLPLDMSGCIVAALRETSQEGHRRIPGGALLATDARSGGAIFVEVAAPQVDDPRVSWLHGEVLARALPSGPTPLRGEVDELVRWSGELGHHVASFYVGFTAAESPKMFRPSRLFAMLEQGALVEHFEVRTRREYVTRVAV